ncbi:P-loop NTPase fold protein, partial [Thermodesulfobacteriota bacterium]
MTDGERRIRIFGDQHWKRDDRRKVDEDSLGFHFKEYAETLADVALNPSNETPICVLVQGEWGMGKTSLMEAIKDTLDHSVSDTVTGTRRVKSVWFNAWKYQEASPVMAGLLGALLNEIGSASEKDGNEKLMNEFKENFQRYKGRVAKAIIFSLPAILDKKLTDGVITEMVKNCESTTDNILGKRDDIDDFQQAFLDVSASWLLDHWGDTTTTTIDDNSHCLAVFIDDLDRCSDGQIQGVLEAVKLFLDFPGVCFYLAMDQHQLDRYLERKFKDRSKDALDKFVQVIFNIPPPPAEDFRAYVTGLISEHPMVEYIPSEEHEIFISNLPANPRAAKRYMNDLAVWFSVLGKVNRDMEDTERNVLMSYAARYYLLAHAVQKRNRAWWNAKTGSKDVLYNWLQSLEARAGKEVEGEQDTDSWIANTERLMSIIKWMLAPENRPDENLDLIIRFRQQHFEPESPLATGGKIDPLTWVPVPDRNFEICTYPVTQGLYLEVMGENPSNFKGDGKGDHPVESVSWFDAVKFCNRLSKKLKLDEVYVIHGQQVEWNREAKGV